MSDRSSLVFDGMILNTDTHVVTIGANEVKLTRTEYAILEKGRIVIHIMVAVFR